MSDQKWTPEALESFLLSLFYGEVEMAEAAGDFRDYRSFKDSGVLTTDAGLRLRMADGSVLDITITQGR